MQNNIIFPGPRNLSEVLKVLVLGGRGCGKTTALASMFHSIIQGASNAFLTISDETPIVSNRIKMQESLNGKMCELKDILYNKNNNTSTFLIDTHPTPCWYDYRIKIRIPGTNRAMFFNFKDLPGTHCNYNNMNSSDVKEYVKQCDACIVVIDTPYLMESANSQNKLCDDHVNETINCVQEIQLFLTYIGYGKPNGQMVIFCPVKCEKWYNEGRIDEVCERVKTVYNTCITNLSSHQRMDISIIPILTSGNLEFVEHKEAYLLLPKGKLGKPKRCAQLTSRLLRLEDGSLYVIKEGDIVEKDPGAYVRGINMMRLYSWFRIRNNRDPSLNGFRPVNCEQLLLHLLRFRLNQYINQPRPYLFQHLLGSINPNELRDIIFKMQKLGILRDNQNEGIIHILNAFFAMSVNEIN